MQRVTGQAVSVVVALLLKRIARCGHFSEGRDCPACLANWQRMTDDRDEAEWHAANRPDDERRAMTTHTCQETIGMIGEQYLRCGKPAQILVQPRGRTEGPYWMCDYCASHNIHNRDCQDVTPAEGTNVAGEPTHD